jgi:hypothetical protein
MPQGSVIGSRHKIELVTLLSFVVVNFILSDLYHM